MKTYKTIIIDDEAIARQRIIRLLSDCCEKIKIVAEAKNGIEGAALINELKPDLIFLDIQMPGKTGFEMLEDLEHIPQVVFCTAYEEFALQAFNTLAIDYLVKPVDEERLQLTMDKLNRDAAHSPSLQINELLKLVQEKVDVKRIQSIAHKIGDRVILIKVSNITYLSASDKYVEFYTKDGQKYVTELSLKKLIDQLPDNFKQVQRSTIVNVDYIKEYRKYFRGKYILVMEDLNRTKLETGRSFSKEIKAIFSIA